MKANIYTPSIQQDLRNATHFIKNNVASHGLSAKLNNQKEIIVTSSNGVILKRIPGEDVAKKMNGVDIYV